MGAAAMLRRNLLDLRPRRDHRPVHRHQAHRHGPHGPGSEVVDACTAAGRRSRSSWRSRCWSGVGYPLVVTGIAQVAFNHKADGSLDQGEREGRRARACIGQQFTGDKWFQPRPSRRRDYDALASGGTNLGPTNPDLIKTVKQRVAAVPQGERARRERAGAGGRRDRVGIGTRSPHLEG